MEHLPEILFFGIVVFFFILLFFLRRRKTSSKKQNPPSTENQPPQIVSGYDSEGYNKQGYNNVGRNRQGKYNRYYNVKCYQNNRYSEEGFLDIRKNPLYLTNHARERMYERMNVKDSNTMKSLAFEAYQFGKSKFQIMKSERTYVEEKELEYGDSVILIYHGYCYVFTTDNGLKTVYKNNNARI